MSPLFPMGLMRALWRRQGPVPDDPLLLAKIINDDGHPSYLISMGSDPYRGLVVTVFEPDFPLGYPVRCLFYLSRTARLCPDFFPEHVSTLDPAWYTEPLEPDDLGS